MGGAEPSGSGGGRRLLAVLMLLGGAFAAGYLSEDRPVDRSYGIHPRLEPALPLPRSFRRELFDSAARLREHKNVLERSLEDLSSAPPYGLNDLIALEEELEKAETLLARAAEAGLPGELASQAGAAAQARREALLALARTAAEARAPESRGSRRSREARAELEEAVNRTHHHMSGLARLLN